MSTIPDCVEPFGLKLHSPCFGGPDFSTIYVTTLSTENNGRFEHGTLYAFEAGVRGLPEHRFAI